MLRFHDAARNPNPVRAYYPRFGGFGRSDFGGFGTISRGGLGVFGAFGNVILGRFGDFRTGQSVSGMLLGAVVGGGEDLSAMSARSR